MDIDVLTVDEILELPSGILEELINNLLAELSEAEQEEIRQIGEEWAARQDKGPWWTCPSVWKRIARARGTKKRRRSSADEFGLDEEPNESEVNAEYSILEKQFKDNPQSVIALLNGLLEEFDLDPEEMKLDRTPAIRAALKKLARAKAGNKRKFLAGATKGFKLGKKTVSKGVFIKKVGGVPEAWKKKDEFDLEVGNYSKLDIQYCFRCEKDLAEQMKTDGCWFEWAEVDGTTYSVPVCDSCCVGENNLNGMYKADQFRIDFLTMPSDISEEDYMVEKFQKTPDGFLKGRSIITNVGVFSYMQPDGSIQRELRLPEEVFREDTVEGFKMLPLTNGHPAEPVNIENIKRLQVGYLGDNIRSDSFYLSAPIMITDAETIAEVQEGKRGLSAGYKCDLERKSGTWLGMQYDAIQRNIRPNHTALVDRGRAGDDARIKMDSMGALGVQIIDQNFKKGEVSMPTLKKIRLDNGVEYEAEDKVIEAYTSAQKKVDELDVKVKAFTEQEEAWKKDKSALEAERDQFKEESEKLKKDLAEAEKLDSKKLNEALEKKMILLDAARRADVEATNKEDEALKREIILKMFPSAKDKLDKAEEAYVNARFDAALEYLEQFEKEKGNTNQFLTGDSIRHSDQTDSPQKAREKMIERQLNAWKKDKSEEEE